MARYVVERNYVQVVGKIWMPMVTAAVEYPLDAHAVKQIREIVEDALEEPEELPCSCEDEKEKARELTTCGACGFSWCGRCHPAPAARCHNEANHFQWTREAVAEWLTTHSGDFSHVQDFNASIGDWDSGWATEEGELAYHDAMDPVEG